jgi:GNAT superfamily N-acetyltransferase
MSTKSETTITTTTVVGKTPLLSSPSNSSPDPFTYTIRPARLSDIPCMSSLAACAYLKSSFIAFLYPSRHAYISSHAYTFSQRIRYRMLSPRCVSLIAVSSSGLAVGYAQFERRGDDAAALERERNGNTWTFLLTKIWLYARFAWDYATFYDKSVDRRRMKAVVDTGDLWRGEVKNRWHAQSVVVCPGHQRRGIGKALMMQVIQKARDEKVPLGLEASAEGERLYTVLGFELLRRLGMNIEGMEEEEKSGGLMVYYPPGCERE